MIQRLLRIVRRGPKRRRVRLSEAEREVLIAAYDYVGATVEFMNALQDERKEAAYSGAKIALFMEAMKLADVPNEERSV